MTTTQERRTLHFILYPGFLVTPPGVPLAPWIHIHCWFILSFQPRENHRTKGLLELWNQSQGESLLHHFLWELGQLSFLGPSFLGCSKRDNNIMHLIRLLKELMNSCMKGANALPGTLQSSINISYNNYYYKCHSSCLSPIKSVLSTSHCHLHVCLNTHV